jgi:Uma2 family endonuclease
MRFSGCMQPDFDGRIRGSAHSHQSDEEEKMEAIRLGTIDDLLLDPSERVELIGGEIVHRPMPRALHAQAQGQVRDDLGLLTKRGKPGGWWILTEIHVAYEAHECPCHDLAGWRRERLPQLPDGVIDLPPDWVCEIISPGHEKKDTVILPLLLRRHRVPFYWIIWPEEGLLVAHELTGGQWRVRATLKEGERARLPPFEAVEIDLASILGRA